jgi:hypothetical protein
MSRNDDELPIPDDDTRFVEKLAALYQPPETTAAERARFAARLDARIARGRGRRRWLAGGAALAATAALIFALLPGAGPERTTSDPGQPSTARPSTEETLLLLANGPLADPDEALPEDYQTLASLLE